MADQRAGNKSKRASTCNRKVKGGAEEDGDDEGDEGALPSDGELGDWSD
jgi:hypothetical protein